jgi:hypothetical protein
VNRNAAGMKVKRCDYLTAAERLVFLALLEVANNVDCKVPDFQTPSVPKLVRETHLSRTTVKAAIKHLAIHGWIDHESGVGQGRLSKYHLCPGEPNAECGPSCTKGRRSTPLAVVKGSKSSTERVEIRQQKGHTASDFAQVNTDIARRDSREEKGIQTARKLCDVPGHGYGPHDACPMTVARPCLPCDKCPSTETQLIGAYRLCRVHAGVTWKEPAA